jgi:hypothetical protein
MEWGKLRRPNENIYATLFGFRCVHPCRREHSLGGGVYPDWLATPVDFSEIDNKHFTTPNLHGR